MKNKIIATLVAFGLVGSASAIEVNDNLSIKGFMDGS
jgi:ribosomal protein L30/L7E